MRIILSLTFSLLLHWCAFTQALDEAGGTLGYSNYLGDLVVPTFTFQQSGFSGSIFGRKHLSANVSLRGNIGFGQLKGDDRFYTRNAGRGNRFKSSFMEVAVLAEYDLLGQRRFPKGGGYKSILSPFIFGGLGFMALSQSIHYGSPDNPDITAAYGYLHPAVPLGMGLRKDISKQWHLALEWGMRLTFSDYIDGVKLSGDPTDNDVYFVGGLALSYSFTEFTR